VSSSNTERAQREVVVEMPQMGVSVAEGTLAVWHKHVGDWVEADEIICEISTDKIDTDLPSPAAGRVVELLVAEDETVPVGAPLARIATDAVPGESHPTEHDGSPPVHVEVQAQPQVQASTPSGEAPGAATDPAVYYSPVAQRIAVEHGIDLSTVKGTGSGGRVRKQDVLAAAAAKADGGTKPGKAGPPTLTSTPAVASDRPQGQSLAEQPGEPLSRMRRAIAEHMTRSLRTAAHCTTIVEADFSRVERERAVIGSSPLPVVARAVIDALRRHPALNATLEDDLLTRHTDVNLGIAVSLGERGLIVPVIHRAQELSAEGLAARIAELARAAREDRLTPDDVRGGTFTITNPGSFGSIASTPIINQPQVAILDLEAVVKRPVAVTDDSGADAITVRPMAYLCLSWDHRALDGALAAQFLATLRGLLEHKEVDP
jgi:pyruvate/2-oxoglutarate dehydrogenase complex dihydrolipoamide acyltransferase (E2) component